MSIKGILLRILLPFDYQARSQARNELYQRLITEALAKHDWDAAYQLQEDYAGIC